MFNKVFFWPSGFHHVRVFCLWEIGPGVSHQLCFFLSRPKVNFSLLNLSGYAIGERIKSSNESPPTNLLLSLNKILNSRKLFSCPCII